MFFAKILFPGLFKYNLPLARQDVLMLFLFTKKKLIIAIGMAICVRIDVRDMGVMYRVCDMWLGPKFGVRLRFLLRIFAAARLKWPQFYGCCYMFKLSEVLESRILCISSPNWPQSGMKVLLNIFLKNWNLQSYNPYQGGLNKKEVQLNICSIFYFDIEWTLLIHLMNLNHLKLGRKVTFMKYLLSVVSLIFPAKTLIWNKITFPASNLQNFAELVENGPLKSIYKKIYQYSFFYPIYHCLM